MQKNVASQKWIVFAFNRTTSVPLTGDAAQITANLRIDGGAANAVDDTNPAELEDGYYAFDLTQAETNGDNIVICPASSTANIQVIGVPGAIWTDQTTAKLPTNYIMGSAVQTAKDDEIDAILVDTGTTLDGNVTAIKAKTDNLPGSVPKNVALSSFVFYMVLSSDHSTAATGKTVTAQRSSDGGAFATCTNAVAEISNGFYKIDFTQAEMNVDILALKFTATLCDQRVVIIKTDS